MLGVAVKSIPRWERNYKIDYAFQQGFLKDFAISLRRANYRSGVPVSQGGSDVDSDARR
ncbi:OprD family outer membrane porin [Pseudomonas qingdaonensis]|uniref:OprD family outer membrane porin n=1 Tax=Pseudomonas qingdaonensis TaxID=2056231 RepID=UPI00399A8958